MLIILLIILFSALIGLIFLCKNLWENKEKIQNENEELKEKYSSIIDISEEIHRLMREQTQEEQKINNLRLEYKEKHKIFNDLKEKIEIYTAEEKYIDCGLYEPIFNFQTSNMYKQKLSANYEAQRQLINDDEAVLCSTEWIVQGSKSNGQKMIKKEKDLMLRTFNAQCDMEINKVRWNNIGLIEKRILKAFADINKTGEFHDIEISDEYLDLKKEELYLKWECQQKIYQEKEEQRKKREIEQEEEQRRIEEEARAKKIEEDEIKAKEIEEKIMLAKEEGKQEAVEEFEKEKINLLNRLEENKRILSRWQQGYRDGYVYVISNIGSFGENIYKIGMTTRADDMETGRTGAEKRVYELNNASVPFKFFIHAAIWTENAPELENKLHEHFNKYRVNKINLGKEFFKVSLAEIKTTVDKITNQNIPFSEPFDITYYEHEWNKDYLQTLEIIKTQNSIQNDNEVQPDAIPQEI